MSREDHVRYIRVLRSLGPQKRLHKAFELSALGKHLFMQGLRARFPDLPEEELKKLYLERIAKCHNRNY